MSDFINIKEKTKSIVDGLEQLISDILKDPLKAFIVEEVKFRLFLEGISDPKIEDIEGLSDIFYDNSEKWISGEVLEELTENYITDNKLK